MSIFNVINLTYWFIILEIFSPRNLVFSWKLSAGPDRFSGLDKNFMEVRDNPGPTKQDHGEEDYYNVLQQVPFLLCLWD